MNFVRMNVLFVPQSLDKMKKRRFVVYGPVKFLKLKIR